MGDHTASGLDTGSPSGRYVEYDYVPEKLDGSVVTGAKALLASVQDVRGELWTYDYYGQTAGETDSNQANFLTAHLSPSVDSDGDGTADGSIALKALTYTLSGSDITAIEQSLGDGEQVTDYAFDVPVSGSITKTTETIQNTGKTISHYFDNGVYTGTENHAGNASGQMLSQGYRPAIQQDANGNATLMGWSTDGKRLEQVTDAAGNATGFDYDSADRLTQSTDAEGRKTTTCTTPANANPVGILVSNGAATELDIDGDMESGSGWSGVGSATTAQVDDTSDEVDSGDYAREVNAPNAGDGIASASWSAQVGPSYLVSARVYVQTSGQQVKLGISGETVKALSASDGEWETLRLVYTPGSTGSKTLQFLAEGGAADFYVDSVHLVEMTDPLRWQDLRYDERGRLLFEGLIDASDGSVLTQTTRTYVASGNGVGLLASLTVHDLDDPGNNQSTTYTYDALGRVIKSQKTSLTGSCQFTFTVYDAAGNVTVSACSDHTITGTIDESAIDSHYSSYPDSTTITKHSYDALGGGYRPPATPRRRMSARP